MKKSLFVCDLLIRVLSGIVVELQSWSTKQRMNWISCGGLRKNFPPICHILPQKLDLQTMLNKPPISKFYKMVSGRDTWKGLNGHPILLAT